MRVCFSTLEAFHKFTSKHASGLTLQKVSRGMNCQLHTKETIDEFALTSKLTGRIAGVTKKNRLRAGAFRLMVGGNT